MKKISRFVSVLMIAVMMVTCIGAVTTVNVSAATASQENTKVAAKTTTKTTNKTVQMKKKAKKSKVQTKKQTKTKTKTTNSSTKKVVVKTTTQTITKTTFKKKSKIKKIKTTVKTTVETTTTIKETNTTTTTENNSNNNTNTNNTTATENKESTTEKVSASVKEIRKAVPSDLLNAFDELGFTITINSSVSYQGVFSTKRHLIELKSANSGTLLHEMGHFLAVLKNNADKTDEWKAIYADEKGDYTGSNKAYVTSTNNEYFAESYRDYIERPNTLKKERPDTYAYVKEVAESITQADIDRTYNMYSWAW